MLWDNHHANTYIRLYQWFDGNAKYFVIWWLDLNFATLKFREHVISLCLYETVWANTKQCLHTSNVWHLKSFSSPRVERYSLRYTCNMRLRLCTISGITQNELSRVKIATSFNEFCNRWCKRQHVECDALKDWKLNIFKMIDRRISFYSQNTYMLPRKPKISYRYLKSGIEKFHRRYVLVQADKAANNVVVVRRLHYINTLKQKLSGTKAYEQTSEKEKSVINNHIFHNATRFAVNVNVDL